MELFKLLGTIAIDNQEANNQINATTKEAEQARSKISSAFSKIGKAAVGLGAAAVTAFVGLAESTREYRTEMGKLDTAFATNGHSAEAAQQTYASLNAVLGDSGQAVEAANHLSLLCQTEQELQSWTDICTGVFATFGASLPIEGLTEAANETAKVGQVTGPLADALNWAGVAEDAFNAKLAACSSEQERQQLITSTLTGLYSDAAAQYQATNQEVMAANMAQQNLTSTMAQLGAVAEPIVTKLTEVAAKLIEKLLDVAAWMSEHKPMVEALGTAIVAVTSAVLSYNIAMNAMSVVKTITTALNGMTVAQYALNTAMNLNPIGLVVAAITALVTIGITLYKNWDTIKVKAMELWKILKSVFDKIKITITGVWNEIWSSIKGVLNSMIGGIEKWINVVIGSINSLISVLNKLISVAGKVRGLDWNLPEIKNVSLPKLERGGILEKGQLGLLEGNGAEAVVPLDQNSAWISAVAQDIQNAVGGKETAVLLERILDAIVEKSDNLENKMDSLVGSMCIRVDGRELGRIVDSELGRFGYAKARGR